MYNQIKFSIITTLQVTLMCFSSYILYIIIDIILGDEFAYYFAINPFMSGLLHANSDHLIWNMLGIFISLNMYGNRFYTFEKIFWITTLLSTIYLPVALIFPDLTTIGISGTCYFLLTRGMFFRGHAPIKRTRIPAYFLISLIIISELIKIGENDHISHTVHLLGCALGIISLYPNKLKIIHEKIYEIIS